MEQTPIPPIVPIGNRQILINRRKKAKRNAIIMAIVCFAITIGMIWWINPDIWLDADDKLNAVRPTKSKILNAVDDLMGSNDWKLKKWGKPISTDCLQIEYKKYPYQTDGTAMHRLGRWEWRDCVPGKTMYPLTIEIYSQAFGWRSQGYCAFISDDGRVGLYSPKRIRKLDEGGWYFMSGEREKP